MMCVLENYKVTILSNQEWVHGSGMIFWDPKQFLQGTVLSPLSHDLYLSFTK